MNPIEKAGVEILGEVMEHVNPAKLARGAKNIHDHLDTLGDNDGNVDFDDVTDLAQDVGGAIKDFVGGILGGFLEW